MKYLFVAGLAIFISTLSTHANELFECDGGSYPSASKGIIKFNSGAKGSRKYFGREGVLKHSYRAPLARNTLKSFKRKP